MKLFEPKSAHGPHPDPAEQAAPAFLRGEAPRDPRAAAASERIAAIWEGIGHSANRPQFLALREQAIARARRANQQSWSHPLSVLERSRALVAVIAAAAITAATVWQVSPYGFRAGVSKTSIGEQRTVELSDPARGFAPA